MTIKIPKLNCHHYTKFGKCAHPDRRGFMITPSCLLLDPHVTGCSLQFKSKKPPPPPPPPPKRYIREDVTITFKKKG